MSLLRCADLWAAPPGAPSDVVRGLSFNVESGEWLAVCGSNGGGKSTVALTVAGLWPARRGTIEFQGGPISVHRREIGVVLQDPTMQLLSPTVREELSLTARNLGMPDGETERRATHWARRFGLEEDLDRAPGQLSAGRQQLVLLAAALVAQPRLLIADEPAVHLDAEARRRVLAAVREEVAAGLAVIWVTQDETERLAADRVLFMNDDRDLAIAPETLRARPGSEPGAAVTISIEPWSGGDGPGVRTQRRLVISVPTRGIVALRGPNGSGKSVILATAVGLIHPSQITMAWSASRTPPPLLASQFPEQQIFEEQIEAELIFAAVSRGLSRKDALARATDALLKVGIAAPDFLSRRCWWLSGGERRVVEAIAALIAPASLLALDEPTAGLDGRGRAGMARLVRERAESGPVLVASQDSGFLEALGGKSVMLPGSVFSVPSLSKKMD